MAEGRDRLRWRHTAQVMMVIANVHRDPKKGRPFKASDFDPYQMGRGRRGIRIHRDNISVLKGLLPGRREETRCER